MTLSHLIIISLLLLFTPSHSRPHRARASNAFSTPAPNTCPEYPLPVPLSSSDATLMEAFKTLDIFLSQQQATLNIPGLMAVVVYDQEIFWSGNYGMQDPFNPNSQPVSLDTAVGIASVTKTFTDLMLFKLRDAGVVHLDDNIQDYLPQFSIKDPFNTNRPVTLRQLASHTSGLPREIPCDWMANCTGDQILSNLSGMNLILPMYTRPHYSNLGVALLGRGLESAAQQNYEDFVTTQILLPLNMTSSGFNSSVVQNIAQGIAQLPNGSFVPGPVESLGWGNPMGGLLATPRDMAKFISFLFREGAMDNETANQILDGSTIREYLSPIINTRDGISSFGTPWEAHYDSNNSVWLRSKAGALLSYMSQITIIPEIKLGVFITGTSGAIADPTSSIFAYPAMDILIPAFTTVLWNNQPINTLPANYETYLGLYRLTTTIYDSVDWEVFHQDGQLYGSYVLDDVAVGNVVSLTVESLTSVRLSTNIQEACRWQDDGMDQELIYFQQSEDQQYFNQVTIMGQVFYFVSKTCPDC